MITHHIVNAEDGARGSKGGSSTTRVVADRTRVVVADGDPLARSVISDLLRATPGLVVIAEAADGVELAELALHYRPEVVLSELQLPRLDGLPAMRRVLARAPHVAFVLLTGPLSPEEQLTCVQAGAAGVLSKELEAGAVARAVAGVAAGQAAVPRSLTELLLTRLRAMPRAGIGLRPIRSPLTAREWEVLDLLGAGQAPAAIAGALGLAPETVGSHLKSITRKLGVAGHKDLIAVADHLCRPQLPWALVG